MLTNLTGVIRDAAQNLLSSTPYKITPVSVLVGVGGDAVAGLTVSGVTDENTSEIEPVTLDQGKYMLSYEVNGKVQQDALYLTEEDMLIGDAMSALPAVEQKTIQDAINARNEAEEFRDEVQAQIGTVEGVHQLSGNDYYRAQSVASPASGDRVILVDAARTKAMSRLRRNLSSVVFCDPSATGAADGSSWADAYTDLASAFTALSEGGTLYTNAPQSTPFGKASVAGKSYVEWITDEGPDGVTWVDGRNFGTWSETSGVFSTAVAVGPEFVAYDMRQDDVSGSVTGVNLAQPEHVAALAKMGRNASDLVAWYGFMEEETSATTTPTEGKWSWVSGTLYINPPGTPTLVDVNAKACWSDDASGVQVGGSPYRGMYIHGDLRTFWTPSRLAGKGYGVRMTEGQDCTLADHTAYLAGYHGAGFASDSLDGNTMLRCTTVGQVASSISDSANAYVFFTNSVDYEDANQLGLDLTFIAFPELDGGGAPLVTGYAPTIALSHTGGTTEMKGVRWMHCAQLDFIAEMESAHSVTISYAEGGIGAANFGADPDVDYPGIWAVSAWDCILIGKVAAPSGQVDFRNCHIDRMSHGNAAADFPVNMLASGENVLRMVGGYWRTGMCNAAIANMNAGNSVSLQGATIELPAQASTIALIRTTTATADFRLGGCRVIAGDEEASLAILNPTAWGAGGANISNIFLSEGGNIFDANMDTNAVRHTNGSVTPLTMDATLALIDPDSRDLGGFV